MDTVHDLTEDHYQRLKQGLEAADKGLSQVKLANLAGIATGDAQKQLEAARAQIVSILQVYFPGR